MIKYFCDKCEQEKTSLRSFEYAHHLEPTGKYNGYVDTEFNSVSGRILVADLCNKCYNLVVGKAVEELFKG